MPIPVIPEYITVHLGAPSQNAPNVTVPFPDYIKNVASSEIYSTWPEEAIRANILAEVSFALNRVYSEWYRSMGYDFDITNNTGFDQKFINGRSIYENISRITDELFNDYLRKEGTVNPLFAQYCDGVQVQCQGLSQWGTVPLAQEGQSAAEIVRSYYGNDTEIVVNAPVSENVPSYPGTVLTRGDLNENVRRMQIYLNRISANYPSIPKIPAITGRFDENTENAVKAFQRIFKMTADGIVGKATWYRIIYIYDAVTKLAELSAEGVGYENLPKQFKGALKEGSVGGQVVSLQYFLALLGQFVDFIPTLTVDGIYGAQTVRAVKAFQEYKGLEPTGEVDERTWNSLYSAYAGVVDYLDMQKILESVGTEPYPGVVLRRGDTGPSVRVIKTYLNYLSRFFYELPPLAESAVFDRRTQEAVTEFQRIFSLAQTGQVNEQTWNTVADVYSVVKQGQTRLENQYPGYELLKE
ncbi:MAG: peptidoglycan-binding protein [Acutalibacteraceae bacterium]|nr:peptidoglycan-binding protein [Acutalibacteraceae bacterium]